MTRESDCLWDQYQLEAKARFAASFFAEGLILSSLVLGYCGWFIRFSFMCTLASNLIMFERCFFICISRWAVIGNNICIDRSVELFKVWL